MAGETEKAEWLQRVLGVAAAARPTTGSSPGLDQALAGWQAARGTAIGALKALEGAFRTIEHPARDKAIILLKAVQANLTAAPTTPQQIKELAAWLNTDDVITEAEMPNGFGLKVELRRPLLLALAALHRETGAGR